MTHFEVNLIELKATLFLEQLKYYKEFIDYSLNGVIPMESLGIYLINR